MTVASIEWMSSFVKGSSPMIVSSPNILATTGRPTVKCKSVQSIARPRSIQACKSIVITSFILFIVR